MRMSMKWLFHNVHSRFIDNILRNEKNWKVHLLQDCLQYPSLYCLQKNFKNFFFFNFSEQVC